MNHLASWTVALVLAASVAVFDLLSGWPVHNVGVALVIGLGLFGVAVGLFVALVIAGVRERRRISTTARTSLDVVAGAARAATKASLGALALCILLFANCSGGIISGPTNLGGPMDDASNYFGVSASVLLPLMLTIVLTAVLASVSRVLTSRGQLAAALRAAQAGTWASVAIAVVAVLTLPVGFFFGISACDLATSVGACAAGASSLMNLFATASVALLLPYFLLMTRTLQWARSYVPAVEPPVAP